MNSLEGDPPSSPARRQIPGHAEYRYRQHQPYKLTFAKKSGREGQNFSMLWTSVIGAPSAVVMRGDCEIGCFSSSRRSQYHGLSINLSCIF
jgi:hypothetical protein